jgi:hypothetical protein
MQSFPRGLLALTDAQIAIIMAASAPLQPRDRSRFLEEIAGRLAGLDEIGDGTVGRVCRELQRSHFDPPQFGRGRPTGTVSRNG